MPTSLSVTEEQMLPFTGSTRMMAQTDVALPFVADENGLQNLCSHRVKGDSDFCFLKPHEQVSGLLASLDSVGLTTKP